MKKPFKPCRKMGCSQLTRESYCESHQNLTKEIKRIYDSEQRDPKHKTFYNSEVWKKVRRLALVRDNHCCVKCREEGKVVRASHVDHIQELQDSWELRAEITNLQALCVPCHNKKTADEKKKRAKNHPLGRISRGFST